MRQQPLRVAPHEDAAQAHPVQAEGLTADVGNQVELGADDAAVAAQGIDVLPAQRERDRRRALLDVAPHDRGSLAGQDAFVGSVAKAGDRRGDGRQHAIKIALVEIDPTVVLESLAQFTANSVVHSHSRRSGHLPRGSILTYFLASQTSAWRRRVRHAVRARSLNCRTARHAPAATAR